MLLFVTILLLLIFIAAIYKYSGNSKYRCIKTLFNMSHTDEQSDDEIFFGKLSLKEFRKHIQWHGHHSTFDEIKAADNIKSDPDASIKIIETHSEPNLRAIKEEKAKLLSAPGSPQVEVKSSPSNDSFLQIESMVSDLCVSPRTSDNVELNNTLEVIEYILKNAPKHNNSGTNMGKTNEDKNKQHPESPQHVYSGETLQISPKKELLDNSAPVISQRSPKKEKLETNEDNVKADSRESVKYFTPQKMPKNPDIFITPSSSSVKSKTPIFKTPAPLSNKKPGSSVKKTPSRSNAYQHIASPIASYIKNCPQVPLVKDVHPKKPLPGPSSIPKLMKSQPTKTINKENMHLPQVAYKSAKKTKVINIDSEKMPQCQWAKKIATLPRPTVMKHENREMNPLKKVLMPKHEDSFANLSCLQAEVSVCTQKTAFKSNQHFY